MNSSGSSAHGDLESPELPTPLIIITVFLVFISIVGTIGNSLVIAVIKRLQHHGRHSNVHTFLSHLALSDLLVCVVCIPLTILMNFVSVQTGNLASSIACKTMRFLQFLAPTISITLLTVISIDRYFAVGKPLRKTIFRRPKVMVIFAWVFSVIQFLPTFHFSKVVNIAIGNATTGYCTPIPYNTPIGYAFLMFIAVVSFVLPLATMCVMYAMIVRAVWCRHRDFVTKTKNGDQMFRKSKKKVIKMLMIVVVAFVCCWLPFVVYCGFVEINVATFPNPGDVVRIAAYCLGLFNSILNPFIYFFSNKNLRNVCIDLVRCRKYAPPGSHISVSPGLTKKLIGTRVSLSPNMNSFMHNERSNRQSIHSLLHPNSAESSPLTRVRRIETGLTGNSRYRDSLIQMSDSPRMKRPLDNELRNSTESMLRIPKQMPTRTTLEDLEKVTCI